MIDVPKFKEALNQASVDTTRLMSAHLRTETRASGWPEKIVRGMHVRYNQGKFSVHSHPDHTAEVLNLEYGTPDTQPTAAIRRFKNRTQEAEHFLMLRTDHHFRKSL